MSEGPLFGIQHLFQWNSQNTLSDVGFRMERLNLLCIHEFYINMNIYGFGFIVPNTEYPSGVQCSLITTRSWMKLNILMKIRQCTIWKMIFIVYCWLNFYFMMNEGLIMYPKIGILNLGNCIPNAFLLFSWKSVPNFNSVDFLKNFLN